MSMLQALIAEGTSAPIRTSNVTRWNSEYFRAEVQCPTCGVWQRKEHNSFCYYCNIWLVEQAAPATVVTPEPVQVEQVQEVTTPESVVAAENATQATPEPVKTSMVVAGATETCFRLMSTMDRPEFGLTADQVFYLVHSKSESSKAGQPVYHIVKWDYELKRWVCPCPDPHRQCCHTKPVNQDCKKRAQQSTVEQQEAA